MMVVWIAGPKPRAQAQSGRGARLVRGRGGGDTRVTGGIQREPEPLITVGVTGGYGAAGPGAAAGATSSPSENTDHSDSR